MPEGPLSGGVTVFGSFDTKLEARAALVKENVKFERAMARYESMQNHSFSHYYKGPFCEGCIPCIRGPEGEGEIMVGETTEDDSWEEV